MTNNPEKPSKNPIQSSEVFGAEVQYFRLDTRYWKPILLKFKESGLKCVTSYVQWGTH